MEVQREEGGNIALFSFFLSFLTITVHIGLITSGPSRNEREHGKGVRNPREFEQTLEVAQLKFQRFLIGYLGSSSTPPPHDPELMNEGRSDLFRALDATSTHRQRLIGRGLMKTFPPFHDFN